MAPPQLAYASEWFVGHEEESWLSSNRKHSLVKSCRDTVRHLRDYDVVTNEEEALTPSLTLAEEYKPRTELGRRLLAIRKEIVDSGEQLLTWDEIHAEIARRRGDRA